MAPMAGHLPVEGLGARCRSARGATEARHFRAIWSPARGRTFLEAAEVLASAPRRVEGLAARHNASGPGALGGRRRRSGRTASLLAPSLLAALAKRVGRPPDGGGLWTGPRPPPGWRGASARRGCTRGAAGKPEADRVVGPGSAAAESPRAATPARRAASKKGFRAAAARARAAHPDRPVEVWVEDEHRPGLEPVRRRVWAPAGERPVALGRRRHEWLHVTASVRPTSGEAVWCL